MKTKFLIVLVLISVAVISGTLFVMNSNLILHLMYSDQYLLETAMKNEIVQEFVNMYPENKIRYVKVLDQEPAIVFEMIYDQKMAFLAVGSFQNDNLEFMYKCFSYDYRTTFFELNGIQYEKQVRDNPCWEI
ncbi:hypothetical protein [Nitrosopumilus adriaticus]|uniref:Uncharacterized protein n=1 Tax=Nitrosopumilus adriaticus TaxID=1580092 RepID=A0A0D5C0U8_9ARCH|nr:hypothetical protein [Nitrosopumilus adriaticus]AJW70336.1 conserved exported protein of unknown function [Nitrosopumilus adriaticus]